MKTQLDNEVSVRLCGITQVLEVQLSLSGFNKFRNKMYEHYRDIPFEILEFMYYQHLDLKAKEATTMIKMVNNRITDFIDECQ